MNYIEVVFCIESITDETRDIVIANMGMLPFDTFSETSDGVYAYMPEKLFDEKDLKQAVKELEAIGITTSYEFKMIPDENWNKNWESNFEPIFVLDQCLVRAPFHEGLPTYPTEIIIEPKMSFGTGHHQTTYVMLEEALNIDFKGHSVIDMGCGTGILAIYTAKQGARDILAIDIDEWAYTNTLENIERNRVPFIEVIQGDVTAAKGRTCDMMFANINRNVLLGDMDKYSQIINKGGTLLLSGFYTEDLPMITECAQSNGFSFIKSNVRDNWVMARFVKK